MKRIWQNFQKEWEVESADHPLILKLRTVSWHWQSFEIHNSRSEQPALSEILKCILLWTANLFVELESYFPWIKNGKKVKVGNLKKNSSNSDFYRSYAMFGNIHCTNSAFRRSPYRCTWSMLPVSSGIINFCCFARACIILVILYSLPSVSPV